MTTYPIPLEQRIAADLADMKRRLAVLEQQAVQGAGAYAAFPCTSSTHPASPPVGRVIFETDTGDSYVYNGSGWTWSSSPAQEWIVTSTSGTLSSIANVTDTAFAFATNQASAGVTVALGATGTTVGTSGTKITINKAGTYDFAATMRWAVSSGYTYIALRHYNSSNVEQAHWGNDNTHTSTQSTLAVAGRVIAAASDYLNIWVFQNTGGAVNLASDNGGCRFEGHYVHP